MAESEDEGEYLHVLGEVDVGEDGLEDGGQGGKLETYIVVEVVFEYVYLGMPNVAF